MGYDVHITRKQHWSDEEGPAITLQEWKDYIASDPEMRLDGYAEAKTPTGLLRLESPGLAVWTAHPDAGDGHMAWFSHYKDRVTVKNPDDPMTMKMHRIAMTLGAKVEGDEGEIYGADGKVAR
jgi:hypothetical protein